MHYIIESQNHWRKQVSMETAAWTAAIVVRRDLLHRENMTLRVQRQVRELPFLWTHSVSCKGVPEI